VLIWGDMDTDMKQTPQASLNVSIRTLRPDDDFEILTEILTAFRQLSPDNRERIF
jgi:hypothetical protein